MAGTTAILQVLEQLHDREVIEPLDANDLSHQECKDALLYLLFVKQKFCGIIKGCGCADGKKQ